MEKIEVNKLTRDYGNNRGIFDVSFTIKEGECFGFLGPNGSGKTTTIRHLMGFINAKSGTLKINGLDCMKDHDKVQQNLGYIPGEVQLFNDMQGKKIIDLIASLKKVKNLKTIEGLLDRFELDPKGIIKDMSKGMKQKIAIVLCFMNDPKILILDEPTSGLDPLMQNKFIELLLEKKKEGKTILLSSHMFEEVEKTCDKISIIKEGKIVATDTIDHIKEQTKRNYLVTVKSIEEAKKLASEFNAASTKENQVTIEVMGSMNEFIKKLSLFDIQNISAPQQNLEDIFIGFYGKEGEK